MEMPASLKDFIVSDAVQSEIMSGDTKNLEVRKSTVDGRTIYEIADREPQAGIISAAKEMFQGIEKFSSDSDNGRRIIGQFSVLKMKAQLDNVYGAQGQNLLFFDHEQLAGKGQERESCVFYDLTETGDQDKFKMWCQLHRDQDPTSDLVRIRNFGPFSFSKDEKLVSVKDYVPLKAEVRDAEDLITELIGRNEHRPDICEEARNLQSRLHVALGTRDLEIREYAAMPAADAAGNCKLIHESCERIFNFVDSDRPGESVRFPVEPTRT